MVQATHKHGLRIPFHSWMCGEKPYNKNANNCDGSAPCTHTPPRTWVKLIEGVGWQLLARGASLGVGQRVDPWARCVEVSVACSSSDCSSTFTRSGPVDWQIAQHEAWWPRGGETQHEQKSSTYFARTYASKELCSFTCGEIRNTQGAVTSTVQYTHGTYKRHLYRTCLLSESGLSSRNKSRYLHIRQSHSTHTC